MGTSGHAGGSGGGTPMPEERRWCKHCARMTWHRREWTFPRSPGLALIALLALPLVVVRSVGLHGVRSAGKA